MLTHHIPEYWFEPRYHNRFISKKKQRSLHQGASIGIDIYKGLQNQNTLRRANLSIVAAKYQLLLQERILL
jgi:hypothetical protein